MDEEKDKDDSFEERSNEFQPCPCCCGCGVDASGSMHLCSESKQKMMAFCTPTGHEMEGTWLMCSRCYREPTAAPEVYFTYI